MLEHFAKLVDVELLGLARLVCCLRDRDQKPAVRPKLASPIVAVEVQQAQTGARQKPFDLVAQQIAVGNRSLEDAPAGARDVLVDNVQALQPARWSTLPTGSMVWL